VPANPKHTRPFTYEPPRIAPECIAREAGGRERRKAGSSGPTPPLPFLSTLHVASLSGGGGCEISVCVCVRAGGEGGLKVIRAEDQKRRTADTKPFLP